MAMVIIKWRQNSDFDAVMTSSPSWPGPSSNPANAAPSPMNLGLHVIIIDIVLSSPLSSSLLISIQIEFAHKPSTIEKTKVYVQSHIYSCYQIHNT